MRSDCHVRRPCTFVVQSDFCSILLTIGSSTAILCPDPLASRHTSKHNWLTCTLITHKILYKKYFKMKKYKTYDMLLNNNLITCCLEKRTGFCFEIKFLKNIKQTWFFYGKMSNNLGLRSHAVLCKGHVFKEFSKFFFIFFEYFQNYVSYHSDFLLEDTRESDECFRYP